MLESSKITTHYAMAKAMDVKVDPDTDIEE